MLVASCLLTVAFIKENKYDSENFLNQYSQMSRTVDGLEGAGEWHVY